MAKKRGPRPKKASERKSRRFQFRVTRDEYRQIVDSARTGDLSPSDYARAKTLGQL